MDCPVTIRLVNCSEQSTGLPQAVCESCAGEASPDPVWKVESVTVAPGAIGVRRLFNFAPHPLADSDSL
jgi:hypothetical protein